MELEDVFREHQRAVYAYFLRVVGDRHDAEELTQETFFRACGAALRGFALEPRPAQEVGVCTRNRGPAWPTIRGMLWWWLIPGIRDALVARKWNKYLLAEMKRRPADRVRVVNATGEALGWGLLAAGRGDPLRLGHEGDEVRGRRAG